MIYAAGIYCGVAVGQRQALGVSPGEAVAFEDSVNGIAAANAAGLRKAGFSGADAARGPARLARD